MRALPLVLMLSACAPRAPAAGPSAILEHATVSRAGAASSLAALLAETARADAVCLGEHHDEPAHHRFQHAVLRHMIATRGARPLALGLEMFQRPYQFALDDYARGEVDEAELVRVSDWKGRWGFDFAMYRPLLEEAHDYALPLVALNAPRELTKAIARRGLEGLAEAEAAWLPESIVLDDARHRRFFFTAMGIDEASGDGDGRHGSQGPHRGHGGHGGHGGLDPERLYAAQVVWDETMAMMAAAVIARGSRILIIAGNGHCHERAIVARIARRQPDRRMLSVLLLRADEEPPPHASSDFVVRIEPAAVAP